VTVIARVEALGLTKRFGDILAVDDVSFSVGASELFDSVIDLFSTTRLRLSSKSIVKLQA